MHYRNGRMANNGDPVVQISTDGKGTITHVGTLIGATPGNDYCNGTIADPVTQSFSGACMCDCLHMEDVAALLKDKGLENRPKAK